MSASFTRGLIIFLLGAAALFAAAPVVSAQTAFNQATHAAVGGFGTDFARVDSQITLAIPADGAKEVYTYLRDKYTGKKSVLSGEFPAEQLYGEDLSDVSVFTDAYFDTPMLDLYHGTNSARLRFRVNTTNPNDPKSGRELVQLKATPAGNFDIRTELKYKTTEPKKKPQTRDELHPLIKFITSSQRADFMAALEDISIDPFSLRHIFTITQTRSRVYVDWGKENILSFSVDEGDARILWFHSGFESVDIGLVETAYTEADEARRARMWNIRDAVLKDLTTHFPALVQTANSKYGIVLDGFAGQIPFFAFLIKYGVL